MITKMLNRKIKNFKCDKLALEVVNNENIGVAWLSSSDQYTVSQIIKMHYTVSQTVLTLQIYCGYKLRTYLVSYPYDPTGAEDDDMEESAMF